MTTGLEYTCARLGKSSLGMEVNTNGPSVQFVKDGKAFKTL